jgi:hypothetical protein
MSDSEEKKNITSIDILKKTQKSKVEGADEIGVEADIPIEDEQDFSLSTNLKPNIKVESVKDQTSAPQLKEQKVQVFNISSGKVVKQDISSQQNKSETVFGDGEKAKISLPPQIRAGNRITTVTKSENKEGINKLWLFLGGIIILVILVYFMFSNKCSESKQGNITPPTVNLTK